MVIGQLLVVLVFCELSVAYPLAGALYQWARRLVGPTLRMVRGLDLRLGPGHHHRRRGPGRGALPGRPPRAFASRATVVLLAAALVVVHTAINYEGVRGTAIISNVGLATEVVATVVIAGALSPAPRAARAPASRSRRSCRARRRAGIAGGAEFLAAILAMTWIFYGFESAADVAEEVIDPARRVPRAMILSLLGAALVTALLLVALVLSAPDLAQATADPATHDPATSSRRTSARAVLRGLLVLLMFAYLSCAGAAQAAAARLVYSYARDGMVPALGLAATGVAGITACPGTPSSFGAVAAPRGHRRRPTSTSAR